MGDCRIGAPRRTLFFVLRRLNRELEREGDFERALAYVRRGISFDPLREDVQRDALRLFLSRSSWASSPNGR
jgi:hypothetical protein